MNLTKSSEYQMFYKHFLRICIGVLINFHKNSINSNKNLINLLLHIKISLN